MKSNGWSEETAALQLFAHLKGEALNVALLLTKEKRESWTGLMSGLSAPVTAQPWLDQFADYAHTWSFNFGIKKNKIYDNYLFNTNGN